MNSQKKGHETLSLTLSCYYASRCLLSCYHCSGCTTFIFSWCKYPDLEARIMEPTTLIVAEPTQGSEQISSEGWKSSAIGLKGNTAKVGINYGKIFGLCFAATFLFCLVVAAIQSIRVALFFNSIYEKIEIFLKSV